MADLQTTVNSQSSISKAKPREAIAYLLESQKKQIALALPKHLTPDRLLRVALTAMSKNPKLLECSQTSLLGAVIQSAQLGLEPDGALGEAYLIPFGKSYKDKNGAWQKKMECQFMPGYRGIAKLVRNSGDVISIMAKEVCANDFFEFEYGINEKLIHKPAMSNRGETVYFYCYVRLKDGGFQFEVMSKADVDLVKYQAYRKNNPKNKDKGNHEIENLIDGVWKDFYVEMARKTVFKKLAKYLPMSVEAAKAFEIEENRELGKNVTADIFNIDKTTGEINPDISDVEEESQPEPLMKPEDLKITDAKIVEETTTTNAEPPAVKPEVNKDEEYQTVFTSGLINKIGKTKTEDELLNLISIYDEDVSSFAQAKITQIQLASKKQFDLLKPKKGSK